MKKLNQSSSDIKLFEVEKILDKRTRNRKIEYKVKWVNYPISECTWEPISNLRNVKQMINEFEEKGSLFKQQQAQSALFNTGNQAEQNQSLMKKRKRTDDYAEPTMDNIKSNSINLDLKREETNKFQCSNPSNLSDSRSEYKETIEKMKIISVKRINNTMYAAVEYHEGPEENPTIKKDLIETEILAKFTPLTLIHFYESKIKFVS